MKSSQTFIDSSSVQVSLQHQELAGTLLLFGLVAGLGLGSLFGPVLVGLL